MWRASHPCQPAASVPGGGRIRPELRAVHQLLPRPHHHKQQRGRQRQRRRYLLSQRGGRSAQQAAGGREAAQVEPGQQQQRRDRQQRDRGGALAVEGGALACGRGGDMAARCTVRALDTRGRVVDGGERGRHWLPARAGQRQADDPGQPSWTPPHTPTHRALPCSCPSPDRSHPACAHPQSC